MRHAIVGQGKEELLNATHAIIRLLSDVTDREAAIELENSVASADISKAHLDYVKSFPELNKLIEERYSGPDIDTENLRRLPQNSFGYLFASEVKATNIDIDYFVRNRVEQTKIDQEIAHLRYLMRKTHDIWHLVTGFDVTIGGEIGLKGFELAQYHSPLSIFSAVVVLLSAVGSPMEMNSRVEKFTQGYQMGLKSKFLLAQKWEERWEQTLTQVRSELNIEPYEALLQKT
jgi:ubiquinone biosynthesis protein COQ4